MGQCVNRCVSACISPELGDGAAEAKKLPSRRLWSEADPAPG